MSWLESFYCWLWYHTEFWLTPVDRRPFTFIMRDWIYTHSGYAITLIGAFYTGMVILSFWYGTASTIAIAIGSFVLAHLVFGSAWIEGQQEYPEYVEEETI